MAGPRPGWRFWRSHCCFSQRGLHRARRSFAHCGPGSACWSPASGSACGYCARPPACRLAAAQPAAGHLSVHRGGADFTGRGAGADGRLFAGQSARRISGDQRSWTGASTTLDSITESVVRTDPASRPPVMERTIDLFYRDRYPGHRNSSARSRTARSVIRRTPPRVAFPSRSDGWKPRTASWCATASSILWSYAKTPTGDVTVTAPLTREFLAELVPDLGRGGYWANIAESRAGEPLPRKPATSHFPAALAAGQIPLRSRGDVVRKPARGRLGSSGQDGRRALHCGALPRVGGAGAGLQPRSGCAPGLS